MAPDWEMSAICPGMASIWARLAFSPTGGTSTPIESGPMTRSRCGRAASSIRWRSAPSGPGPRPRATASRPPRAPRSAIACGRASGGRASTARSGTPGSAAISGTQGRPIRSGASGQTGQTSPVKAPAPMLRRTVAPIEPGTAEAPITATERGVSTRSRLRMVMRRCRSASPSPSHASSDLLPSCAGSGFRHLHRRRLPATLPRRPRGRASGHRAPSAGDKEKMRCPTS